MSSALPRCRRVASSVRAQSNSRMVCHKMAKLQTAFAHKGLLLTEWPQWSIFPAAYQPSRQKHSNRYKRLHMTQQHYENVVKPKRLAERQARMGDLQYEPTYQPEKWLPNGWSPPPPPGIELPRDKVPFQVERTAKGRWLPVYTDIRKGKTQLITIVRRITGDTETMRVEMQKVCEGSEVAIRTGPKLEVKGRYTTEIRQWLAGLGF